MWAREIAKSAAARNDLLLYYRLMKTCRILQRNPVGNALASQHHYTASAESPSNQCGPRIHQLLPILTDCIMPYYR